MISNKDLYDEIKKIDDTIEQDAISDIEFKKASLKAQTLNLKLLHNLRTNMVTVMKHNNIEFPKARESEDQQDQQDQG